MEYLWIIVKRQQIFGIIIWYRLQGSQFSFHRILIPYAKWNLVIRFPYTLNNNKINFRITYLANIDFSASARQFQIDDILQYMPQVASLGTIDDIA